MGTLVSMLSYHCGEPRGPLIVTMFMAVMCFLKNKNSKCVFKKDNKFYLLVYKSL